MLDLIEKLLGSKAFTVAALVAVLALLVFVGYLQYQNERLDKKLNDLQKAIDTKDEVILELNQGIKLRDFEISYLQRGMEIAGSYEREKEQVLGNGSETKINAVQAAMSTEEGKAWWETPIPGDILNLIACH